MSVSNMTSAAAAAAATSTSVARVINVKVSTLRPLGFNDLAAWMYTPPPATATVEVPATTERPSSLSSLPSQQQLNLDHVYIGRGGIVFINGERFPKTTSLFANPFKITTTAATGGGVQKKKVKASVKKNIEQGTATSSSSGASPQAAAEPLGTAAGTYNPPLSSLVSSGQQFPSPADGSREDVINRYRVYALNKIKVDSVFRAAVKDLRGKTLGCWCKPEACHGDVLIDLCEMLNSKNSSEEAMMEEEVIVAEAPHDVEVKVGAVGSRAKRDRDS